MRLRVEMRVEAGPRGFPFAPLAFVLVMTAHRHCQLKRAQQPNSIRLSRLGISIARSLSDPFLPVCQLPLHPAYA